MWASIETENVLQVLATHFSLRMNEDIVAVHNNPC